MSSPVDVSLALIPAPPDAPRSIAVTDQAVSGPRACSRSRKSLPLRLPTSVVSNFASTDAKKVHLPLERKGLIAGSRKFLAKNYSVQHRCCFDLNQEFWICQSRDADPGTCGRILRRKGFS